MRIEFAISARALDETDREFIDVHRTNEAETLRNTQADYERHRWDRYKAREDALQRQYQNNLDLPRPANVPMPRLPTRSEITQEARSTEDRMHSQRMEEIRENARRAIRERVGRSLGLDRPEEDPEKNRDR
ncbi:MAG: hypothetical protein KDH88_19700 [Chromatiales bacterium]|nr:hypothetical protein [Chromatiales bacterium]